LIDCKGVDEMHCRDSEDLMALCLFSRVYFKRKPGLQAGMARENLITVEVL
jgi:hypothetical protein